MSLNNSRKNINLWIGLSLPVLVIIAALASALIPKVLSHPQFNFLFASDQGIYMPRSFYFKVDSDGKLIKEQVQNSPEFPSNTVTPKLAPGTKGVKNDAELMPSLYLYDVKTNTTTKISFETAQKFKLSDQPQSPDGFQITFGANRSVFNDIFFNYNNNNDKYLEGHGYAQRLEIPLSKNGYSDFQFLGWVIQ